MYSADNFIHSNETFTINVALNVQRQLLTPRVSASIKQNKKTGKLCGNSSS